MLISEFGCGSPLDPRAYLIMLCRTYGTFLRLQLTYCGKTVKSLSSIDFPSSFCLSVNEKHYSNEVESIKVLEEIVIPYTIKDSELLCLTANQPAHLTMDVLKGQLTNKKLKI